MVEHQAATAGQPGLFLPAGAVAQDVEDPPAVPPDGDGLPRRRTGHDQHYGEPRPDTQWSLTHIAELVENCRPFAAVKHLELPRPHFERSRLHLEVPRPWRLLKTATWSLGESIGVPLGAYLVANWAAGQTAGLLSGLAAVWLITVARKLTTGSVPGLLMISAIMLTLQTALVLATGATWIYLLQFPVAKFGLCLAFARSARTSKPMVAQLATEVVGLLHPSAHYPGLQRFFQRATWLWAAIFLALTCAMGVWVATEPITGFIFLSSVLTGALVGAGTAFSALWFFSVLRRLGLRLRFTPAT